MSFLSLASAWYFLLLLPLAAFYFLKLKRPRQVIPSLVLWRQVLNDQRVNSPFQRFKRNLLLLLQILLLSLFILALMQPILRRQQSRTRFLPVLIDTSASMGALDKPGGISRLEAAKQRVRVLLDGLAADQELCLVAFGKSARRLTGFTNNTRQLREALDTLEVEDVPGDLEEALRLTQALARATAFERVMLISDGNFPARANFELPFQIDYQRLAEPAGPNFGITACTARRAADGDWELFVQLSGSANAPSQSGRVELLETGTVIGSSAVTLVSGNTARLSFNIPAGKSPELEVRLIPGGFDSLASDNTAWLTLPAPRPLDIFVPASMNAFRHALEALDGVRLFPREDAPSPAFYDLAFAGATKSTESTTSTASTASTASTVARVTCSVGIVPPELEKLVTIEKRNSVAMDWRRESPLLQHVTLNDVIFMDSPQSAPQVTETDFANAGFVTLAQASSGPLLVEKHERDSLRVHMLFDPERSTLPYRVGFPVLVSNLVQIAQNEAKLSESGAAPTGLLPALVLAANRDYVITGPGNLHVEARSDAHGALGGVAAPRAGRYELSAAGAETVGVGASLVSAAETSLAGIERIEFAEQLSVHAAGAAALKTDRNLWWPLAMGAFGLLLLEWWFFQKRAG